MAQRPSIYTIQASDAPQHTGKLQTILQTLKSENRIESFNTLGVDDDLSSLVENIEEEDLVLILLTRQLQPYKEQIEDRFRTLKANRPDFGIAEIIVDNITFAKEFLALPVDLRPIRDREDMDEVWISIEQHLKDMLPVLRDEPDESEETDGADESDGVSFMRILLIALAILLIGWIAWNMIPPKEVEVKVPDMTEMTLNEARAELENEGLVLGRQLEEHNHEIQRNRVIRSNPSANIDVKEGTRVSLYISLGPESVEGLIHARGNQSKCMHKRQNNWNNGNPIHLWDCDAGVAAFKKWIYEAETGYIRSAENPGKCLHKREANWNNGNPIHLWDCDAGIAAFKTWVYEAGTGYIRSAENPEKCMHKRQNNWNNGNPIHLWDCDAGVASFKTWTIE